MSCTVQHFALGIVTFYYLFARLQNTKFDIVLFNPFLRLAIRQLAFIVEFMVTAHEYLPCVWGIHETPRLGFPKASVLRPYLHGHSINIQPCLDMFFGVDEDLR